MRKLILLTLLMACSQVIAQPAPHVRGDLVSSVSQVAAGDTFRVIFAQDIDPDWHTYWMNPGDSGAAPSIKWDVPEGVTVGEFAYPYPERIAYGPLMNFGYHHEVRLPFDVSLPNDFDGAELVLNGSGQVLVCADICIPQKVTLSLTVPVGPTEVDESQVSYFEQAERRIPAMLSVPASFTATESEITLTVGLPSIEGDRITKVEYFPLAADVIDNPSEQSFRMSPDGLELTLVPGYGFDAEQADFSGVLVIHEDVGDGVVSAFEFQDSSKTTPVAGNAAEVEDTSLLTALVFAFLGGLILNLMPCVFPVLSIKILSLVESVHEEGESIRLHGWAYALGVVASFVAIAAVLIVLRAGGEAIGWGFQLQSPMVVSLLAYLFLVIGLNLMGVFEIALSVSDSEGKGYTGSISTGVLATVVAAPCTAPFMGAALGYALLQAPVTGILVFAALGFGMAVPYLLLCYSPALLSRLPRPGNWMVVLRQALAFPMFASAIWLVWVLGIQAGPTAMMQVLGGGLIIAFGIWLLQQSANIIWKVIAAALIVGALSIGVMQQPSSAPVAIAAGDAPATSSRSLAQPYSAEALQSALADGPVFVNFTAAWCITCKVNELNALETTTVREAFKEKGITYLKADWTNEDPKITAALQEYGRTGVPLYLLYEKGAGEAEVLPQILTPSIVTDALDAL
ncbi:MAG: thioredoxin family protein [Pseudomonadales bacterium]|nr:thioredoxin family protein [Pseudomonadales bacterium]MBO6595600.1 thioredoxin family protein [Pseudomonadales bacterium]MBO6820842.1 thioredoxin family protein [Pseudomonadales bacterium]